MQEISVEARSRATPDRAWALLKGRLEGFVRETAEALARAAEAARNP